MLSLGIQLPVALALALMVGRDLPGRAFFRMIFFVPYVLSEVITGIIWMGLFKRRSISRSYQCPFDSYSRSPTQNFLSDLNQVMFCIFIVLHLEVFGLHMLLYLAGLQNIPREIEEAVLMGWANRWQLTRHHYHPYARQYHPHGHPIVRPGLADAVQPGLGHDRRWTVNASEVMGDLYVSPLALGDICWDMALLWLS